MAIFTEVRFYNDLKVSGTAYTENGLHRCAPRPTPDNSEYLGSVTDVNPKNRLRWSEMVVDMPYDSSTQVYWNLGDIRAVQPSFITIKMDTGNLIYGWIDSIQTNTYLAPSSNFIVRWHVDWWLTMGTSAEYKAGRLKRGPSSYARPDPSTPRKWVTDTVTKIGNGNGRWCIVQYVYTDNGNTSIKTLFWEVGGTAVINGTAYQGLTLEYIYSGAVEEIFGLDADSVIGAWISPVPPLKTDALTPIPSSVGTWYAYNERMIEPDYFDLTLTATSTSDSAKYIIVDPYGAGMATVPWGLTFDTVRTAVDIGASGAGLLVKFLDSTNLSNKGEGEGRETVVPLITVPITSNNWESYNISGQRAYDIETARIQNEQQLVNGVAGAATAAATGAVMGSIVPGVGTLAGAAVGLGSSLISTGINFGTGSMYRSQTQAAVDRLMSNQANNLAFGAGGASWASGFSPGYWELVKMVRDSVSLAELSAEQSELGYLTDTQVADCSTIISGKGGLRIEGLEVLGIGTEGGRYISQMFARGVHLD